MMSFREVVTDASFGERLILAVATATDAASGMSGVLALLRRRTAATRVEWWAPGPERNSLVLTAVDGQSVGPHRQAFSLGPAGAVVVTGGPAAVELQAALDQLVPILRRRLTEEQLVEETALLARRNAALEDFAALVAHELKGTLEAARLESRSSTELGRAIELVDAILDTLRSDAEGAAAVPDRCLEDALRDLGAVPTTVEAALPPELPVEPTLLRVILRNLVANAVAAGAGAVHIEASALPESWSLHVDDDGVGLDAAASGAYSHGSGVGLALCRRIAERGGGAFDIHPLAAGGTRATVRLARNSG